MMNNIQVNPVAGNTINAPSGYNLPLGGNLTGSGTLTNLVAANVLLSGNNAGFAGTYVNTTGNTFLASPAAGSAAASWVLNSGILANVSSGTVTIGLGALSAAAAAAELGNNDVSGGQVTYSIGELNSSTVYSGTIVDTVNAGGTTAIAVVGGSLALTGNNSYSGGTTLSNGTIVAGSTTALGSGLLTLNGGTLQAAYAGGGSTPDLMNNILVNAVAGNTISAPAATTCRWAAI